MKKILILSLLSFSFAVYDIGETVLSSDQEVTKSTCFSGNGYNVNDNWKLADWNGATNDGHYNVIFIEMSTTW